MPSDRFSHLLAGAVALLLSAGCYTVKTSHVYTSDDDSDDAPSSHVQGNTVDDTALRELLNLADSRDAELRCNAIESLQDAAPDDAVDPAEAALDSDNVQVRFAGCMVLGTLRVTDAHQRLLKLHDEERSRVVQVGIRFALHRLGDVRYSHDLEKYAVDPDPEVRGKTALVLGRLGEPSAIPILRAMQHDPDEAIRLQAAESLWRLGDQRGLDDLAGFAISKYADDLIISTLALAAPRDPTVIQHVRANLDADYPEVELAAARALGMLGSDEGYPLAMQYLHSSEPRQRWMAAQALGAIGRPDAKGALAGLLNDSSDQVRLAAAAAILELHKPS
ncbi:MAG TPA: HEAT repeat domain-containing protein [Tepidisphaeraceae bacterium]|nr:HEAT repeat domain-containing protein [Tepidisphaeraceae bacterium]